MESESDFSREDIAHQITVVRDLMNRLAEGSTESADNAMLAAAVMYTLGAIGHLTDQTTDLVTRQIQSAAALWGLPRLDSPGPADLPLAEKG